MELKEGIGFISNLSGGSPEIQINSGVVHHSDFKKDKVNYEGIEFISLYEDDAYLPKNNWRNLRSEEIKRLNISNSRKDYNTIFVGEIPNSIKEILKNLELSSIKYERDFYDRIYTEKENIQELNNQINLFLDKISDNKPFAFRCFGINVPGLEIISHHKSKIHSENSFIDIRHIGLHNDGDRKMTLSTAYKTGNRVSINIGKDDRYFLFINLTLIQIVNLLRKKMGKEIEKVNIANIPTYFFKYFPDYPIIRIKQKPYQFYIAPTNNCLHDGSTIGASHLDMSIIYFGHFLPK